MPLLPFFEATVVDQFLLEGEYTSAVVLLFSLHSTKKYYPDP